VSAQIRALEEVWSLARTSGMLGNVGAVELRKHALGYIIPEFAVPEPRSFVDCGTGAGVLGIFLALELPESKWWLVDTNLKRCEIAAAAVRAVELEDRVEVQHRAVEQLVTDMPLREKVDGVVARRFGKPAELAECALPLLRVGGRLVTSVSSVSSREWRRANLQSTTGCLTEREWSIANWRYLAVRRVERGPETLPRRVPARQRRPLF